MLSRLAEVFNNEAASGVSVNDGATALTLIFGANSAARALIKPSTAPFAEAMDA